MCSRSQCFAGVWCRAVWCFNVDWTTADSAGVRLPRLCEILALREFENVARPPDIGE